MTENVSSCRLLHQLKLTNDIPLGLWNSTRVWVSVTLPSLVPKTCEIINIRTYTSLVCGHVDSHNISATTFILPVCMHLFS